MEQFDKERELEKILVGKPLILPTLLHNSLRNNKRSIGCTDQVTKFLIINIANIIYKIN